MFAPLLIKRTTLKYTIIQCLYDLSSKELSKSSTNVFT